MKLKRKYMTVIMTITTQEFNQLKTDNFTATLAKVNLATKGDIDAFL